jgi:hypothetical protein
MPDSIGDVKLKVYISSDDSVSPDFTITIYEGPIENGLVLTQRQVSGYYFEYTAMLYKDYTLSVEYTIKGKKYIAIDEARPKVRYDETTCSEPCYYVYDNVVDLRLKYTE